MRDRLGRLLEWCAFWLLEAVHFTHLWFTRVLVTSAVLGWLYCWWPMWRWLWSD